MTELTHRCTQYVCYNSEICWTHVRTSINGCVDKGKQTVPSEDKLLFAADKVAFIFPV